MEALTLLLMFLTVPGYSFFPQPRLTLTQISEPHRGTPSEMKGEQLRDFSASVAEQENNSRYTESRKTEMEQRSDGLTPETNQEKMEGEITAGLVWNKSDASEGYKERSDEQLTEAFYRILGEERKTEEFSLADMEKDSDKNRGDDVEWRGDLKTLEETHHTQKLEKSDQVDGVREEIEEEESELVAGINLHLETGRDGHEGREMILAANQEKEEEKEEDGLEMDNYNELGERRKKDHIDVGNLTPPLSTSSPQPEEITDTQSQNLPLPHNHHHNVPPSPTQVPPVSTHPPSPHSEVTPQFLPPSINPPNPTAVNLISVPTVAPDEVLLLEDLLTEVLQSPGHQLKQNALEQIASLNFKGVQSKNILDKPAKKGRQTTREINTVPPKGAATQKATKAKLTPRDLQANGSNSTSNSNENNPRAQPSNPRRKPNMARRTGNPKTNKPMENDTKQNKASPPQPQLTKPAARTWLTSAKTPSTRPTNVDRSSKKKKTSTTSKEKKRKKDNKTQKPPKKMEVVTPTHFPYFLDDYCPPECACYGRVVQCSDKGVDKVPYGIPYNARFILLMNNHIDSIQLDLLSEYVSMEFLVLSNNRLTDGTIEGALEGIPALKRLYLDRNRLKSVPTDLPLSLEELRLDSNQLSVMSEAAWARCPNLLVLSLSNNTLGNGLDSLPDAVLSPLWNLRTLNLDHNQLTSVPLGLPLSIKELYLKGNLIEQFHGGVFNGISGLVVLDLSENRLTNKGFFRESLLNATHLESLNLEGNSLKQVPRHLPSSLKTLNLEGNLISSVKKAALVSLKNLEHLGLARNKILKVAPGTFKTLPVLHQLDLSHNSLRQVPRQLPQALHSVVLTHNQIQSVPRDAFCWGNESPGLSGLVRVQLGQNLIDMGKLDSQAFRCLRGFQVVHFY